MSDVVKTRISELMKERMIKKVRKNVNRTMDIIDKSVVKAAAAWDEPEETVSSRNLKLTSKCWNDEKASLCF